MALYFKCPKCGLYFMDMAGEFALNIKDLNGDYCCPNCGTISDSIKYEDIGDNDVFDLFDIINLTN